MIHSLNTLRAIAALIVVVTHYSKSTGLFGGFVGRGSGQMGVMLFFIISGFLMAYLYLQNKKPFNPQNTKNFIVSRAARVLPLYLLLVVMSFLLMQINQPHILYNIPDLTSLVSHVLLLKGVSVFWTIPPEIHFYLFFIMLWLIYSKNQLVMYLLCILICVLAFYYESPRFNGSIGVLDYDFSFLRSLPYFSVGMMFGLLYRHWSCSEKYQSGWYVLTLLTVVLMFPDVFEFVFGQRHGVWQSPFILLWMAVVFYCCVFLTPKDNSIISNRLGDFLGKISYSIYLLHMPVLRHFKELGKSNPELYLFLYIACTIVVSYFSYLLIEKPLRKFFNNKFKKIDN